uniref:Uncharacterized protein n=1 Tax=Anguilla anguilla TaxID=7936 RepID=A0A0E9PKY6_ANGAN
MDICHECKGEKLVGSGKANIQFLLKTERKMFC